MNYVVKKGDSLYSIAKQYNTDVATLIKLNNLHNNFLHEGQILKVKEEFTTPTHVGSDICGSIPLVEDTESEKDKYDIYTVKSKDNLYSIAKKFNTNIGAIKYINNLKNNILSIGQILKLPKEKKNNFKYIVQKNDNLYSIANKFGITVEDLKRINKLSNNIINIGDILIIPTITYPIANESNSN